MTGTERLCKALYGRTTTDDSEQMLHDAAGWVESMQRKKELSILTDVCRDHAVTVAQVRSKSRKAHLVRARVDCMIQAHRSGYTHEEIGKLINRDRSTVTEHIKNYNETA